MKEKKLKEERDERIKKWEEENLENKLGDLFRMPFNKNDDESFIYYDESEEEKEVKKPEKKQQKQQKEKSKIKEKK